MACAALLLLGGATYADNQLAGKVIIIQDGDTLTLLDLENVEYRIRLAGIDAPEKNQPFGYDSLSHLSDLCFGMLVRAVCPKVDRYGRAVCTVFVDGKDINLAQVAAGLAWHYKRFQHEQTREEREAYALTELRARSERLGLWREDAPIAPWEWRNRFQWAKPAPPPPRLPPDPRVRSADEDVQHTAGCIEEGQKQGLVMDALTTYIRECTEKPRSQSARNASTELPTSAAASLSEEEKELHAIVKAARERCSALPDEDLSRTMCETKLSYCLQSQSRRLLDFQECMERP